MAGNPVSGQFFVDILHKSFDSRLQVATLAERDAIPGPYRYVGMVVFVDETKQHFEFKVATAGVPTAGDYANNTNWVEVENHIHANLPVLNQFSVDANGILLFNGVPFAEPNLNMGTF